MAILKPTLAGNYLGTLFIHDPAFEPRVQDNVLYIKQIKPDYNDTKFLDLHMQLWEDYDIDTLVIEKDNFNHTNQILYLGCTREISNIKIFNKNKDWDVILGEVKILKGTIELENASVRPYDGIKFRAAGEEIYGGFDGLNQFLETTQSIKGSGKYGIRAEITQWDTFKKIIGKEKYRFNVTNMTHIPLTGYDITGKLQHLIIKI
nr:MAG TPA: hypothetical protein [Caudoviricetes sp.]